MEPISIHLAYLKWVGLKVDGAQSGWGSKQVDTAEIEPGTGKGLRQYTMQTQRGWGSKWMGLKVDGAQSGWTQLK